MNSSGSTAGQAFPLEATVSNVSGGCASKLRLDHWSVATGVALGVIAVGTIFGNSLVLLAVLLHRSLRSTTAIFVSNLAVADLLLGTCVLPLSSVLEVTQGCWLFGSLLCDLWASVDVLCCTASIMSLCAISMDRYVGVTRPLQRPRIVTHRRACLVVLCVWILSLLVSVGPLIGWRRAESASGGEVEPNQCSVSNNAWYILFSSIFSFYLPLAIVVFFYARVYKAAVRQTRFLNSGMKTTRASWPSRALTAHAASSTAEAAVAAAATAGSSSSCSQSAAARTPAGASDATATVTLRVHRGGCGHVAGAHRAHLARLQTASPTVATARLLAAESMQSDIMKVRVALQSKLAKFRREKKAAKTLGIVVGVFIVCWLPFFFLYPFKWILCKSCDIPELWFKIAFWLGYCNSLCNPIIYACWNREFRRAFARILTCRLGGSGGRSDASRANSSSASFGASKRLRARQERPLLAGDRVRMMELRS